jgi:acyl-CoA oxidase
LEVPVIEYQLQQNRLFPILATAFALHIFHDDFLRKFELYLSRIRSDETFNDELVVPTSRNLFKKSSSIDRIMIQASMSREIHGLSCSVKPIATWWGVEALAEARRSCGGHGCIEKVPFVCSQKVVKIFEMFPLERPLQRL